MPEELDGLTVAAKDLARLFGLSVRRIQQLTQDGIIRTVVATDENGRSARRYDLVQTVGAYVAHLSEKAHGKAGKSAQEAELKARIMRADLKVKQLNGELKNLNLQIRNGQYLARGQVVEDYAAFFTTFKKFANGIPAQVVSSLSGLVPPEEARRIRKEVAQNVRTQLCSFVLAAAETGPEEVEKDAKSRKTLAKTVSGSSVPAGGAPASEASG